MNRRRADESDHAPTFVRGILLVAPRGGVLACLLLSTAFGCGGLRTGDPAPPRHLTTDRPNAPFAEPNAIQGVAPLATATSAASTGNPKRDAKKAGPPAATAASEPVAATPPTPVANASPAAPTPTAGGEVQFVGQVVRGERARGAVIAEVDVERCFQAIPSYRSMKGDRNSRDYARYLLTITAANEEFRAAVESIALRDGFDVVVEKGGVRGARTVDITDAVCERLAEQKVLISR